MLKLILCSSPLKNKDDYKDERLKNEEEVHLPHADDDGMDADEDDIMTMM